MKRTRLFCLSVMVIALANTSTSTPTVAQGPPGLLVYPYLGSTTTGSVVISWATDSAGASEVRYSLDQDYSDVVPAASNTYDGKHWHSAVITGLAANTTYYYKAYTDSDDVTPWSEIRFTTAPGSAAGFTFVALGDSRPYTASSPPSQGALDVAAEMDRHSFDLAIHSGDIVNQGGICSGDNSAWNQYIRAYFDLYQGSMGSIPFYPSVGNHELNGGSCGYQAYTDVYDLPENAPPGDREEYFSYDWGQVHFVVLDTNQSYTTGSSQYDWLVNDLQATARPWKIVSFHHPAYSSGAHSSTSAVQAHLVPVFETYGVDVVFNGHDHHYERTCPILSDACTTPQDGGVVYYVTGGGGAPLYPALSSWFTAYVASRNHFVEVEVDDCRLRLDAVATNGSVFDSYDIHRCGSPTPTATAADTATPTATHTATATATAADTDTPTPTAADTATPTAADTGTPTPTATATAAAADTATPTAADTGTPTPTATAAAADTATPTATATAADTATPTATVMDTATPVPVEPEYKTYLPYVPCQPCCHHRITRRRLGRKHCR